MLKQNFSFLASYAFLTWMGIGSNPPWPNNKTNFVKRIARKHAGLPCL